MIALAPYTHETGYCLKVFPEDRGWQVYFGSIGLNFFGWFLLSTLSLSFENDLPTFPRTLGWGSLRRQWTCDNHAFVQFDVELNISCTKQWCWGGVSQENWSFQSDAGSTRDVAHFYAIFPCCLTGEIKMIHLVGQLTTWGGGTSLLQSAPFPIDSHYKESLRRGL